MHVHQRCKNLQIIIYKLISQFGGHYKQVAMQENYKRMLVNMDVENKPSLFTFRKTLCPTIRNLLDYIVTYPRTSYVTGAHVLYLIPEKSKEDP